MDRGCEVIKVCVDPGDLILWDSRTMHWNCLPESEAVRSVLCELFSPSFYPRFAKHECLLSSSQIDMCYTPASYAKPDDLALKAQLYKERKGTVSSGSKRQ